MGRNNLLAGTHPDIINANVKTLKDAGMGHSQAMHLALKHSSKTTKKRLPNIAKQIATKSIGKFKLKQPRLTPSLPKIGGVSMRDMMDKPPTLKEP